MIRWPPWNPALMQVAHEMAVGSAEAPGDTVRAAGCSSVALQLHCDHAVREPRTVPHVDIGGADVPDLLDCTRRYLAELVDAAAHLGAVHEDAPCRAGIRLVGSGKGLPHCPAPSCAAIGLAARTCGRTAGTCGRT